MSCFAFPKGFCDKIEAIIRRFWWGGGEEKSRIHRKNWAMVAAPKWKGGMGFRNLQAFNLAMLANKVGGFLKTLTLYVPNF